MIEANINIMPDDNEADTIKSMAIEHQKDFDSYQDAYNYFYSEYIRGCYETFNHKL